MLLDSITGGMAVCGRRVRLRAIRSCAALMALGMAASSACAQAPDDLAGLSLEQLASIQITSVSKRTERLGDAAASVYVITADDIRRSGATRLTEALRLAPNLQVAQISAANYAVSARGFNSMTANKLLVLVDGRSVYTPLFAGVFWDVQDVVLQDIERIEVVSGPGGTLWGTNAVEGVINVITKSSSQTLGGVLAASAGNRGRDGEFRYGGTLGNDGTYRVYGKYFDQNHTVTGNGTAVNDAWHKAQAGFRADWQRADDQLVIKGNYYEGAEEQPQPGLVPIPGLAIPLLPIAVSGGNVAAHWMHYLDSGSNFTLQAFVDRTKRDVPLLFSETLNIVDLQLQHTLLPIGRHSLVWGASYRYSFDRVTNSAVLAFQPAHLNQAWSSLFAQDDISVHDDLRLTLGARIERNDYTGSEFLPNARLAWKLTRDHLLWTAVSRAVRAPSRLDRDIFIPAAAPFLLTGGPGVRSEVAKVFELGYRGQPTANTTFSVTAAHAIYDHLRTLETGPGFLFFGNEMEGTTTSLEMWGIYRVSPRWRLSFGATALHERLQLKPGSTDRLSIAASGSDPASSWMLRSSFDVSSESDFDVILRRIGALSNPAVPAYSALSVRYGWRPRPDIELSLTAQNLYGDGHAEFGDALTRSEFGRSIAVKVVGHF